MATRRTTGRQWCARHAARGRTRRRAMAPIGRLAAGGHALRVDGGCLRRTFGAASLRWCRPARAGGIPAARRGASPVHAAALSCNARSE